MRSKSWVGPVLAGAIAPLLAALLSGHTLEWRDTSRIHAPLRGLVVDALREGRLPLWNPYEACGSPLLARLVHGVLHPVSVAAAFSGAASPGGAPLELRLHHQNSTSYWYFHTDQWRYETVKPDDLLSPAGKGRNKGYSLADYNVVSTRLGWLPSNPHFNKNPVELAADAAKAGATDEAGVAKYVAEQLKSGALDMPYADPDAPENWPRNLFVWRANLIGTSAKGHEYFLKHLLGAQNGVLQESGTGNDCKEVKWRDEAPAGKLDLMVDINFRLNSTGAYSDIILPTATWYESTTSTPRTCTRSSIRCPRR